MPIWLYQTRPLYAAIVIMIVIETISLLGLFLARHFLIRRFHASEGINDAISGTVQAIGVFYGITVGLIAVAVWNTYSQAGDLVSREAASIGAIYRDVGGYPSPLREQMRSHIREYTVFVIEKAWPEQRTGRVPEGGVEILDELQSGLFSFEPSTQGQAALHAETLRAYNNLIEYRRLRIDAVESGLSDVMWAVIWAGAIISIGVAYFFRIDDAKLHALLVALMAGFLAIVIFMIVINDKPFYGSVSVSADPYKIILERLIDRGK
ncbi:MAG TPA: DUF4239 domain-containing protein [Pyrinomonadaceae bacterium]|nr:DUF4239 domain-containing protein [Pyrinomonadaceae bacterium]HZN06068.1 DUF4239 domain-containing protein [Pyrinomonadaceae bacterium]